MDFNTFSGFVVIVLGAAFFLVAMMVWTLGRRKKEPPVDEEALAEAIEEGKARAEHDIAVPTESRAEDELIALLQQPKITKEDTDRIMADFMAEGGQVGDNSQATQSQGVVAAPAANHMEEDIGEVAERFPKKKGCSVCGRRPVISRGMCKTHYLYDVKKNPPPPKKKYTKCVNCGRTPIKARGLCDSCYQKDQSRKRKEGDVNGKKR